MATLEAKHAARPQRHRGRSFLAAVLIVIGCILAPLSVVAVWANDLVGNTDRYVSTVAPLASNSAVQNAVANRATDAVMSHINLSTLLVDVAPADKPRLEKALGKLGNSLEGAVRSFVHDKALAVTQSSAFKTIWIDANRKVHSSLDKALTGSGGGAIQLKGNTVVLDLGPVVDQVKTRLVDSGMSVASKIPSVHTDFTLFTSDKVSQVKTYVRVLQVLGNWLPVIAILLVVAGVLVAVRRRRTVVTSALAVAVAVGLLAIGLRIFRAIYLDRLPANVSQDAASAVYDTLTRFLFSTVRMVIALGIVIALGAWLTGRGRHAAVVRGLWTSGIGATRATADRAGMRTGPVGPFIRRYRTWIVWILVIGALVALLLWSFPTAWVVLGIALCLLFVMAVVEFLAAGDGEAKGTDTPRPAT
ncbi:hypothetical protein [Streptomyces sp. NPDC046821]|uniref:hypothetical protein n=1 Tax=Streptomyces sp. NPDC046821 TaxID=3154702 RepID=UPI0033CABA2D